MERVKYNEVQRFRQWWMWLIICSVDIGLIIAFVMDKVYGSSEPVQWWEYLVITIVLMILTSLFLLMNLSTRIDETGIHVRFFPFHFREKHFAWEDISKAYVRRYSPLWEFGGWGIKYGFQGKAYNVSGNEGIQLELKSGKRVLIGTTLPKKASETLVSYGLSSM